MAKFLGHNSSRTTEIYTHVSTAALKKNLFTFRQPMKKICILAQRIGETNGE